MAYASSPDGARTSRPLPGRDRSAVGEDPGGRGVRGRQDHVDRVGQRDRPAAHRGSDDDGERGRGRPGRPGASKTPPRWRWTSAGSRSSPRLVLYLFGMPGQRRFWDLWEGLAEGAVGALVLADTRRLEHSFEVLDQFETHTAGLPFAVAVNQFPDSPWHGEGELADALDLPPGTPVTSCDARDRAGLGQGPDHTCRARPLQPEGAVLTSLPVRPRPPARPLRPRRADPAVRHDDLHGSPGGLRGAARGVGRRRPGAARAGGQRLAGLGYAEICHVVRHERLFSRDPHNWRDLSGRRRRARLRAGTDDVPPRQRLLQGR